MFTLEKLELEEGQVSLLPTGYTSSLPAAHLFDYETDEHKPLDRIEDVEVGYQVILTGPGGGYHRTSKIREIVSVDESKVVFKTQTSIYQLTQRGQTD